MALEIPGGRGLVGSAADAQAHVEVGEGSGVTGAREVVSWLIRLVQLSTVTAAVTDPESALAAISTKAQDTCGYMRIASEKKKVPEALDILEPFTVGPTPRGRLRRRGRGYVQGRGGPLVEVLRQPSSSLCCATAGAVRARSECK